MTLVRCLLILVGAVATLGSIPADEPTATHILTFATGQPALIQIRARYAGQPIDSVWKAAVGRFFDYLDRNGDGKLSESERAILGTQSNRRRNDLSTLVAVSELANQLKFDRPADPIDTSTFTDALRSAGFGPTQVAIMASREDTAAMTANLFKLLDTNGDESLSPAELRLARDCLGFLDVNEDEWLTRSELSNRAITAYRSGIAPGRRSSVDPVEADSGDFLTLNGLGLPAVKQILAKRGKPKSTTLTQKELGLANPDFQKYDRDANGSLDTDELLAWLNRPPLFSIDLDLAVDPTRSSVKPLGISTLSGVMFEVSTPASSSVGEWTATAYSIRTGFKSLAKDGRVLKSNIKDQPALTAAFALLDRNADEALDEKELEAGLGVLAALANCRVSITVLDRGRGLFEWIDSNRDEQLSLRELAVLPAVAKPLLGAQASLAKSDVPRSIIISPSTSGIRLFVNPVAPMGVDEGIPMTTNRLEPTKGPSWFVKMDRNGDGDVSRKEFLGPLDRFRKLDTDGDGLISIAEAEEKK